MSQKITAVVRMFLLTLSLIEHIWVFKNSIFFIAEKTAVLILGGGLSGVSAAKTLQAAGVADFLLLEASGRLGGRIRDTTFSGTYWLLVNWLSSKVKSANYVFSLMYRFYICTLYSVQ